MVVVDHRSGAFALASQLSCSVANRLCLLSPRLAGSRSGISPPVSGSSEVLQPTRAANLSAEMFPKLSGLLVGHTTQAGWATAVTCPQQIARALGEGRLSPVLTANSNQARPDFIVQRGSAGRDYSLNAPCGGRPMLNRGEPSVGFGTTAPSERRLALEPRENLRGTELFASALARSLDGREQCSGARGGFDPSARKPWREPRLAFCLASLAGGRPPASTRAPRTCAL